MQNPWFTETKSQSRKFSPAAKIRNPITPPYSSMREAGAAPPTPPPPQDSAEGGRHRKKGGWVRTWVVVDSEGRAEVVEGGKHAIMQRTGLPARDLRMLDPSLSYPSTVLGRERAIVVNLENIRSIITSQEMIFHNSKDPLLTPFVQRIQGVFRHRHAVVLSQVFPPFCWANSDEIVKNRDFVDFFMCVWFLFLWTSLDLISYSLLRFVAVSFDSSLFHVVYVHWLSWFLWWAKVGNLWNSMCSECRPTNI